LDALPVRAARPDLFESDEELADFLEDLYDYAEHDGLRLIGTESRDPTTD